MRTPSAVAPQHPEPLVRAHRSARRAALHEGPVSRFLDQAVRHLWLGVLWTTLSATVLGLPAASAAVDQVLREWREGDERPVLSRYLRAVREHGWRASAAGGLIALVWGLLLLDLLVVTRMGGERMLLAAALLSVALPLALATAVAPGVITRGHTALGDCLRQIAVTAFTRPALAALGVALGVVACLATLTLPPLLVALPAVAGRAFLAAEARGSRRSRW